MKTSLISISLCKTLLHLGNKFVVFQAPARDGEETGGRLGDKAFKDKVGTQTFKEIDDEVYVFVRSEEMKVQRVGGISLCHASALDELKLMKFEQGERKFREDCGFVEHVFARLARESENEMSTNTDATSRCTDDGINSSGVGVTTIDT